MYTECMGYTPITDSFKKKFSEELCEDFPEYFRTPIACWLLRSNSFVCDDSIRNLQEWKRITNSASIQDIEVGVRQQIPRTPTLFFSQSDLVIEVLNYSIKKLANDRKRCEDLEKILCKGGHAYKVAHMGTPEVCLVKRVSDELEQASEKALKENILLREAWSLCYKRDPNYAQCVAKCVDALETKIKQKYYPNEPRPSLGKFLNQMENDASINYVGNAIDDGKKLFKICSQFADFRGQHTSGSGKVPTEEDARFILHTSILLYNMI